MITDCPAFFFTQSTVGKDAIVTFHALVCERLLTRNFETLNNFGTVYLLSQASRLPFHECFMLIMCSNGSFLVLASLHVAEMYRFNCFYQTKLLRMEDVLNQMFLICSVIPIVSLQLCHCSTKFNGTRVVALHYLPSQTPAQHFPTGTVQNSNAVTSVPGRTIALQQLNCQMSIWVAHRTWYMEEILGVLETEPLVLGNDLLPRDNNNRIELEGEGGKFVQQKTHS